MTRGEVQYDRTATVAITIHEQNGANDITRDAIIDTRFDGALSLPATVVAELELLKASATFSTVFGGEVVEFATHNVIVTITGEERSVQTVVAENPQKLEKFAEAKPIDLFYDDECGISLLSCVPYGGRFKDEPLSLSSTRGKGVNGFALLARDSPCFFRTTQESRDPATVGDYRVDPSLCGVG